MSHSIDDMDVIRTQQRRMKLYKELLEISSCIEEQHALKKAYEISRLIHIKDPNVIERQAWLLENMDRYEQGDEK